MYDYLYPVERRIMEDRLAFLEREYNRFEYMINPYHLNPGILLDVDITSIKRKKATLDAMANVLNEFLHGVSKGFQDAAFASYSRRRSTVREDITQSFSSATDERPKSGESASSQYLDLINTDESVADAPKAAPKAIAAPKRGRSSGVKAASSAKNTSSTRGRPSTKAKAGATGRGSSGRGGGGAAGRGRGRPRGRDSGLREV
jgi:hypothetical protein